MSSALLQLILNGEVHVNDFILWLCGNLPENKTCVKLSALDPFRSDFVHFLLNYIRENTRIHVREPEHSGIITPRKATEKKNERRSSLDRSSNARFEFRSDNNPPDTSSFQGTKLRSDPRRPIATKNPIKTTYFQRKSNQKLSLGQFLPHNDASKNPNYERSQKDGCRNQNFAHEENLRSVFDFSDDSAFPPVGIRLTKNSKQPTRARRITPTPVSQWKNKLPGSEATISTVSNESTNASFVNVTSNERPISYDEERELLRQERAKRQSELCHLDNTKADNCVSAFDCLSSDLISPCFVTLSPDDVTFNHELDLLSELYAAFIRANLISSLSVELHFLVHLITVRGKTVIPKDTNSSTEEASYFGSAANCVYFALNVLWQQRQLLLYLDKSTLRLLFENPRVETFSPYLHLFLEDACKVATSVSQYRIVSSSMIGGVAFHSDTDNKNNFINEQGFHLFRKKRDLFYEIFREWQSKHLFPEYNVTSALRERIRSLVFSGNDPTTYAHLARLFQSQLVVTCKRDGLIEDESDSLDPEPLEVLKKSNPEKYKRLADRFVSCQKRFGGPSPKPSFTGHQEFFTNFIIIAGSHDFNQHLIDCFSSKIYELNDVQLTDGDLEKEGEMDSDVRDELVTRLLTLRLLAKFLGFVVFLPYQCKEVISEDVLVTLVALRQEIRPIIDINNFIKRAIYFRRTVFVIPWIVEFLSMMDPVAPSLRCYRTALTTLRQFYKLNTLDLNDSQIDFNRFLVITLLGWLFEVVNYVKTTDDEVDVNPDNIDEKVDLAKYEALDSIALIDGQIVYICCPYLADLRVLLSEFESGIGGPMRKITPLSMSSPFIIPVSTRNLQVQLEENFFHNHPVSLKRTVEFVVDRVSSNVIKHVRKVILPSVRNRISIQIKQMSGASLAENLLTETKSEVAKKVQHLSLVAAEEAELETISFAKEFCPNRAETVLRLLLSDDTDSTVLEMCVKIVQRMALKKVSQWFTTHVVADVYYKELVSELQKNLRAASSTPIEMQLVVKAGTSSIHDDSVLGPAYVVRSVKTVLKTLYDTSKVISFTTEEAADVVAKMVSLVTLRSDVTNMALRTVIQQSVDYAMALVIRRPEVLTDALQDELIHLWTSYREISSQFLESVLCSRNIHYLTSSDCSESSWIQLSHLIAKLLHSELVTITSLTERMIRLMELEWSQETIKCLKKFDRFLIDFILSV